MRASSWSVVGGILVAAGCSSAFSAGTGGSGGSTGTGGSASTSTSGPTSSSTASTTASSTTSHSTTSHSTTTSSTSSTSTSASTSTSTASGPDCPAEAGAYSITGSCGTLDKTSNECIKPQSAGSCVHILSATGGISGTGLGGVSGTIDVDSQGNFDNTSLTIGGISQQGCSGTWMGPPGTNPATLEIKCNGGCDLTLTRTAATCQ